MLYVISYVNISIENIHVAVFAKAPFLPYALSSGINDRQSYVCPILYGVGNPQVLWERSKRRRRREGLVPHWVVVEAEAECRSTALIELYKGKGHGHVSHITSY